MREAHRKSKLFVGGKSQNIAYDEITREILVTTYPLNLRDRLGKIIRESLRRIVGYSGGLHKTADTSCSH